MTWAGFIILTTSLPFILLTSGPPPVRVLRQNSSLRMLVGQRLDYYIGLYIQIISVHVCGGD